MAKLVLFPPGLGLPTFDPACLQLLTFLRMAGWNDLQLFPTLAEQTSTSGTLPMLKVEKEVFTGDVYNIITSLPAAAAVDADLTPLQRSTTLAFNTLLLTLDKARVFEWFFLDNNYERCTRPLYGSHLAFPLSYYLPGLRRTAMTSGRQASEADEIYASAERSYAALSTLLGQNLFFFGEKPHSLDALVFGQLAVHVAASQVLPDRLLLQRLQEYPNLIGFVQRMAKSIHKIDLVIPVAPVLPAQRPAGLQGGVSSLQQLAVKPASHTWFSYRNARTLVMFAGTVGFAWMLARYFQAENDRSKKPTTSYEFDLRH